MSRALNESQNQDNEEAVGEYENGRGQCQKLIKDGTAGEPQFSVVRPLTEFIFAVIIYEIYRIYIIISGGGHIGGNR